MTKKYSKQQVIKRHRKKCFFCGEDNYDLLDAHRIVPGEEGGKYHLWNVLVLCACCHRLVHSGEIKIDRKYMSTAGLMVHFWRDGKEFWIPESK